VGELFLGGAAHRGDQAPTERTPFGLLGLGLVRKEVPLESVVTGGGGEYLLLAYPFEEGGMERAEIIGVGTELIYGETLDTNTAEIAKSLEAYALKVERTLRVVDEPGPLAREVAEAWERARLLVLSGGLGPTPDDVTREAVAQALGEPLELDEAMLARIEALFRARGRPMPEANRKQALKIPSARWLENPHGTAPGWWVRKGGKDLVLLPGPPPEWRPMWREVLPKLALPQRSYAKRVLKTWGLGESEIVERLGELFLRGRRWRWAPTPSSTGWRWWCGAGRTWWRSFRKRSKRSS
jgi:nicotinamide-nucleotide amidase